MGQVVKWSMNGTDSTAVMNVTQACTGLFISLNNTLYCSMIDFHQVVTRSLDDSSNELTIIAGAGCSGSSSDKLSNPYGIFVDITLNLYVADYGNHRIQLFRSGELNGTTVAGDTAPGTIILSYPMGVILDEDGYLFILDSNNNRIVGSGPTGFRCVAGCSSISGSASDQLSYPRTMAFDSYGNLFVMDANNARLQKFVLADDSCGM